jgi:urea transporter
MKPIATVLPAKLAGMFLTRSVNAVLVGFGQIYLQASATTGAVVLLCLWLTGSAVASAALLCAAIAQLLAYLLQFPKRRLRDGLYVYNAALCGAGLVALYRPGPALLLWIAAAAVACVFLSHFLLRWGRLPVYTLPFVLVMLAAQHLGDLAGLERLPALATLPAALFQLSYALAQVSFVGNAALGMLVLTALAAHRWHDALHCLCAGALAWLMLAAAQAAWPTPLLANASIGIELNCMLAALGLAAAGLPRPWRALGVLLCLSLGSCAALLGWPCYTLPFILANWCVLLAAKPVGSTNDPQYQLSN